MITKKSRGKIDVALKAKIAFEAAREQAMVADLAQCYEVHPNQIYLEEAASGECSARLRRQCWPSRRRP
ncbi:hypothetical protein [Bradyrhizobium vignae]|nr:hypothetical protein [Bradyrhizobium vignae]